MQSLQQTAEKERDRAEEELERVNQVLLAHRLEHQAALKQYKHWDEEHEQRQQRVAHLQGSWQCKDVPGKLRILFSSFRATDIPDFPSGGWVMELGSTKTLNFLRLVREHSDGLMETQCLLYRLHDDQLDLCFNQEDRQRYPVGFDLDDSKTTTLSFRRDSPRHEGVRAADEK